jgi:uncharacterized protein (TIGR02996 family)
VAAVSDAAVDPILAHPGRVRDLLAFLARVESGDRDDCLVLADFLEENDDEPRAEYIRASVELEQLDAVLARAGSPAKARHLNMRNPLLYRRAALISKHSPQWTACPCLECGGRGWVYSGHNHCVTCGGTGDLFRVMSHHTGGQSGSTTYSRRIDPELDFHGRGCVPLPRAVGCRLAEVGREQQYAVYSYADTASQLAGADGYGTVTTFNPSPWARAAVAACPTLRGFRCTDRVLPYTVVNGSWWRDGGRDWAVEAGVLPAPVFEATWELHPANRHRDVAGRSLLFPTESAASDALATALHRIVAATSRAPSGPTPPAAA